MKHVRLILTTLAVATVGTWAVVEACDHDKATKTSSAAYSAASTGTCSAAQAAQAAECRKHASAAAASVTRGECPYHTSASAMAASAGDHCAGRSAASNASASDHCAGKASATSASNGSCAGKAAALTTASNVADHCGSHNASAAFGACSHDRAAGASASACRGQGIAKAADASSHIDCDACADMATCEQEIQAVGATTQVVPLKNGVMFVYIADSPSKVRAVQAALARRSEHMMAMTASCDRAHLSSACKEMRGAAASGKLNREVVNIEGGCLTLMTSNDPAIVAKIRAMAGVQGTSRAKI